MLPGVRTILIGALVGASFAAAPNLASADFQVVLLEDWGNTYKTVIGPGEGNQTSVSFGGHVGDFSVSLSAVMNPATGITITQADIHNNDKSSLHEFMIILSGTGFTPLTNPQGVTSTVSGSLVWGSANGSLISYVDLTNQLLTNTNSLPPIATPLIPFYGETPYSPAFGGTRATNFSDPSGSPFSLSIVNEYTFGADTELNMSGSAMLAPAPAGLVLALSAVPMFAAGYCVRRRRALA